MRLSAYFLPTLRENPAEAQIASHRLMLRAGMIRQSSAGIYSWLPLGFRVLKKIEQIVREEQDRAGAQEMLMPTIQPAELWRESGRYEDYGKEMLRITDRHEAEHLYGPTNEELITAIVRDSLRSYRDLPKNLYHIQWKFRDEVRPRFGVMRGREFLMKDAYSFDLDEAGARRAYYRMFLAYLRSFARMGLKAIPMRADTGPIGGELSHEFIILAETGESAVYCDPAWLESDVLAAEQGYDGDLEPFFAKWTSRYAATDEIHDAASCPVPADRLVQTRGIEVGHIFSFGTKYSVPMKATVAGPDGREVPLVMGSYGIGVSRLVGAIIEASHDANGIIWPEPVAPFDLSLINLKPGDEACRTAADALHAALEQAGVAVLYDDREAGAGVKFADADLIGLPQQVILGPRGVAKGLAEVKTRRTGERSELPLDRVVDRFPALSMVFGAFERMVAFRYLRARRQESFISVIAFFSLAGIMLGVATLIIVMSVMNGFRAELLDKILGFNGDLSVLATSAGGLTDFDATAAAIRKVPGVTGATPLVEGEVLASSPRSSQGAKVRGEAIDDMRRPAGIGSHISAGSLAGLDEDSVVLGDRLALSLGVQVGDMVTLLSPNGMATALGTIPRVKTYRVAATFDVGMYEYDSGFIYMTLPAAQLFFRLPGAVSEISVSVTDPDRVYLQEGTIAVLLGGKARVFGWQQSSAAFFNAVETERNVMFLILTLIIVVAAFNVISSMIMLVKDKGRDIAILRTMGATRGMILRIFFLAGASVGVVGTLLGFGLGLLFCDNIESIRQFLQHLTGTDVFNPTIYFLSQLPAKVDPTEVAVVTGMALGLSFLATIYPSWRAARLDPVEALRYE